jgi:hypothetical protein
MKYSSSIRSINVAVFAILFAAFGALGCYFSFFVTPEFFIPTTGQAQYFTGNVPYNFAMEFGVLGLSIMVVALLGLILSIRSVIKESDDKIVTASFLCYIAIGYILCAFLLFNCVWFYRLIGKSQIAWWIIVSLILLIAALIASNIPMMKMLEDADPNVILIVLTGVLAVVSLTLTLTLGISLLATKFNPYGTNVEIQILKLFIFTLINLAVFALSLAASLLFYKNHKAGVTKKLPSLLGDAALFLVGGEIIATSIVEYIYRDTSKYHVSFQGIDGVYAGLDFVVVGYVFGGLVAASAIALFISNLIGDKKAAAKEKA